MRKLLANYSFRRSMAGVNRLRLQHLRHTAGFKTKLGISSYCTVKVKSSCFKAVVFASFLVSLKDLCCIRQDPMLPMISLVTLFLVTVLFYRRVCLICRSQARHPHIFISLDANKWPLNNDDLDPGNKRHGDSEHAIEQAAYDPAHQYAIIETAQNLPYAQSSIYIRSTMCLISTNLQ